MHQPRLVDTFRKAVKVCSWLLGWFVFLFCSLFFFIYFLYHLTVEVPTVMITLLMGSSWLLKESFSFYSALKSNAVVMPSWATVQSPDHTVAVERLLCRSCSETEGGLTYLTLFTDCHCCRQNQNGCLCRACDTLLSAGRRLGSEVGYCRVLGRVISR